MEPWLARLNAGDCEAAWDLFQERYRRLILATIRRLCKDHDDVMDLFSTCCHALCANDFARLRSYAGNAPPRASVATWLVAVVRNLTVDWLRRRDGRPRRTIPAHLSALQQQIYDAVCIGGYADAEAYEIIQARTSAWTSFREFLVDLRQTRLTAPCPREGGRLVAGRIERDAREPVLDPAESAELSARMRAALASQPADVRLAIELFVVERMSADDVARVVGWPNARAVYNRVSRALARLRAGFEAEGLTRADFR